jgi:hypothetical protein
MGNAVNNSFKNFSFERVFPFQERATRIYGQKKKLKFLWERQKQVKINVSVYLLPRSSFEVTIYPFNEVERIH